MRCFASDRIKKKILWHLHLSVVSQFHFKNLKKLTKYLAKTRFAFSGLKKSSHEYNYNQPPPNLKTKRRLCKTNDYLWGSWKNLPFSWIFSTFYMLLILSQSGYNIFSTQHLFFFCSWFLFHVKYVLHSSLIGMFSVESYEQN